MYEWNPEIARRAYKRIAFFLLEAGCFEESAKLFADAEQGNGIQSADAFERALQAAYGASGEMVAEELARIDREMAEAAIVPVVVTAVAASAIEPGLLVYQSSPTGDGVARIAAERANAEAAARGWSTAAKAALDLLEDARARTTVASAVDLYATCGALVALQIDRLLRLREVGAAKVGEE